MRGIAARVGVAPNVVYTYFPDKAATPASSLWRAVLLRRPVYNQSKLANVLFTYELASRLADTSNALHPGVVRTSFGAADPGGVQRLLVRFMRPFHKVAHEERGHIGVPGVRSRRGKDAGRFRG